MKILIIQLRRIGDILLTTPVIPYLKTALGDCEIDFLCEPCGKAVLETNPLIHELLIYDKAHPLREIRRIRKMKYDLVFDFMNNPRSAMLAGLSGARETVGYQTRGRSFFYKIRIPVPLQPEYVPLRKLRLIQEWLKKTGRKIPSANDFLPKLFLTEADQEFSRLWLEKEGLSTDPFVVLVPAHRHPIRQWTAAGFRGVGLRLAKENIKVLLACGPGEEKVLESVLQGDMNLFHVMPPTSIRQMASFFQKARLVVTNDSGAMHLSVAVNTSTVTVYGPTRPVDWNPSLAGSLSIAHVAITAENLNCLGCHLAKCSIGHLCMENLNEKTVAEAALQILNKEKKYVG